MSPMVSLSDKKIYLTLSGVMNGTGEQRWVISTTTLQASGTSVNPNRFSTETRTIREIIYKDVYIVKRYRLSLYKTFQNSIWFLQYTFLVYL